MPVVALTADAPPQTRERRLACGMDDFLTKPINVEALMDAVAKYLPRALELRRPAGETAADPVGEFDAEIFDAERFLSHVGALDREAVELLRDFLGHARGLIEAAVDSPAAGNAEETRRVIHALKGSAGSARAPRLHRIAADMRDRIKAVVLKARGEPPEDTPEPLGGE